MEFETDEPTRERVARSILENGPSTAAALAERLDLTPAAVRRHLDQLVEEGAVEAREPRVHGAPRPRPPGQGVRAHRARPRRLRPAVRRPRRRRRCASWPRPAATRPSGRSPTGGSPFIEDAVRRRSPTADPSLTPGRGAGPGAHRRGLRCRGARRCRWPASSCASSTARSPTWPTSSRSCARPRPRRSAGCSAATSSGWPPSPTATACAPPASPTPRQPTSTDTRGEGHDVTVDRRAQPRARGHRPLRVRLGRHRRRRRRPRSAASTRTSSATSPRRRASRSGCSTCA